MNLRIRSLALGIALGAMIAGAPAAMAASPAYQVRNLVSDVPGAAEHTDPNLVNGWGVAFNPFGFVWVADNGTGVATLYDGAGNPAVPGRLHPRRSPDRHRVQRVERLRRLARAGCRVRPASSSRRKRGIIAAWAPNVDPHPRHHGGRQLGVRSHLQGPGARRDGTRFLIYATDFHNRKIDVFDKTFSP